jgi:hypothetical protein
MFLYQIVIFANGSNDDFLFIGFQLIQLLTL